MFSLRALRRKSVVMKEVFGATCGAAVVSIATAGDPVVRGSNTLAVDTGPSLGSRSELACVVGGQVPCVTP